MVPLRSEILCYMWYTLALMDLVMVVDWPKHLVLLNLYKTSCNQDSAFVVIDGHLNKLILDFHLPPSEDCTAPNWSLNGTRKKYLSSVLTF